MKRLKGVLADLNLWYHRAIGKLYLETCVIFKVLTERISPDDEGLLVNIYQDGSCCICIDIFRVESLIFVNGLLIWNC